MINTAKGQKNKNGIGKKPDTEIQQIYDELVSFRAKFTTGVYSTAQIKNAHEHNLGNVLDKMGDAIIGMLDAMAILEDEFKCE